MPGCSMSLLRHLKPILLESFLDTCPQVVNPNRFNLKLLATCVDNSLFPILELDNFTFHNTLDGFSILYKIGLAL
jgi:hypothetical protein